MTGGIMAGSIMAAGKKRRTKAVLEAEVADLKDRLKVAREANKVLRAKLEVERSEKRSFPRLYLYRKSAKRIV